MCDRQEIQYNFQQALTQADKLDDVADCLRRISENSMEEIGRASCRERV